MRNWLYIALALFFCKESLAQEGRLSAAAAYNLGKVQYAKRAEGAAGAEAQPQAVDKAIAYFRIAMRDSSYEAEAGAALLRAFDFKGNFTSISKADKLALFEEGKTLGKKLATEHPDNAAIQYWYMTNLGRWGQTVNFWTAVKSNVAGDMRELCEKIATLDSSYNYAGALRLLGILNIRVPYIPVFITWPSDEMGMYLLKRATEIAPDALGNWVFYAEALYKKGQDAEAREILKKLRRWQTDPKREVEEHENRLRVARLWDKVNQP